MLEKAFGLDSASLDLKNGVMLNQVNFNDIHTTEGKQQGKTWGEAALGGSREEQGRIREGAGKNREGTGEKPGRTGKEPPRTGKNQGQTAEGQDTTGKE